MNIRNSIWIGRSKIRNIRRTRNTIFTGTREAGAARIKFVQQVIRRTYYVQSDSHRILFSRFFITVLNPLLSGCHEDQRLCRTNDIRFISEFWCAWGSKCTTFDAEVDLNDDAVGRTRYERFYSVRSNYARENLSLRRRSREPSRVGCLWRNFRVWSWGD